MITDIYLLDYSTIGFTVFSTFRIYNNSFIYDINLSLPSDVYKAAPNHIVMSGVWTLAVIEHSLKVNAQVAKNLAYYYTILWQKNTQARAACDLRTAMRLDNLWLGKYYDYLDTGKYFDYVPHQIKRLGFVRNIDYLKKL